MPFRIVFFDCDGTLTKVKSSWEYLHRRLNLWEGRAEEYQRLFRAGLIGYEEFCRRDALLWKGLAAATVEEIVREIPYQPGVRQCMGGLKEMGVATVILSTGISALVEMVQKDLGVDLSYSNSLLSAGGVLTGDTAIRVGYDGKGPVVREALRLLGAAPGEACAVGDGEGDLGMFACVGLSIGFRPQPQILPFVNHVIDEGPLDEVLDIVRAYG
jgi:phosphoserine phosphatase